MNVSELEAVRGRALVGLSFAVQLDGIEVGLRVTLQHARGVSADVPVFALCLVPGPQCLLPSCLSRPSRRTSIGIFIEAQPSFFDFSRGSIIAREHAGPRDAIAATEFQHIGRARRGNSVLRQKNVRSSSAVSGLSGHDGLRYAGFERERLHDVIDCNGGLGGFERILGSERHSEKPGLSRKVWTVRSRNLYEREMLSPDNLTEAVQHPYREARAPAVAWSCQARSRCKICGD